MTLRQVGWRMSVLMLIVWLASVGRAEAAGPGISLSDLDNQRTDPFRVSADVTAIVFLFTSVDCPISNRYAPVVGRLHDTFGPKGVVFWLVYPNPFDAPDTIRHHVQAYAYPVRALLDPQHLLAKFAQAAVTPEAAVYDRQGRELYHGRIDNRYVTLGLERPAPTQHDLEDALTATLAGQPVKTATTQAVGCYISDFVQ
jgi:hypothetical protein